MCVSDGAAKASRFSPYYAESCAACLRLRDAKAALDAAAAARREAADGGDAESRMGELETSVREAEKSARRVWATWRVEPRGLPRPAEGDAPMVLRQRGVIVLATPAAASCELDS